MEGKTLNFGSESQKKVIKGVTLSVQAVEKTLGPSGKCVAINSGFGAPEITRDGATVIKSIAFSDQAMNMGAQLVKKAASLTESQCGDATSTCSILIRELCLKGQRAINSGANVNEIKSGMLKAGKWMENYIRSKAIAVDGDLEKIRRVATISANNDPEIGDLIVDCMSKVGIHGVITSDLSAGLDTEIDITTGMRIERGWLNPMYVTNPSEGTCVMENAYVVLAGEKISNVNQLINILQQIQEVGNSRPFLLICDDIDQNVNAMLIQNVLRGALRCCVIKSVEYGDARKNLMQDIAVATGGVYLTPEFNKPVAEATIQDLGVAKKIVISKDSTTILEAGGDPEQIKGRAAILAKRLEDPTISDYEKNKMEKRIAGLVGGIGVIRAGGATEAEKQNRKATLDDAILASKSAIAEGCVPGGGYTYLKGSEVVKEDKAFWESLSGDEVDGANIVFSSLPGILYTIAKNSGNKGDVVVEEVKKMEENHGYNAKTKQLNVNLIEEGVLDAAKVARVALENAISTASMILLIDCTIIDEKVDSEQPNEPEM